MDETGSSKRQLPNGVGGSSARAADALDENPPTVISPNPIPEATPSPLTGSSDVPLHPLERAKLLRGELLDHFQLEDFVGVGGMGIVFRAHDTMLNRTVAVKVLSSEQARDAEIRKRFRNEAQSAARLDHENVARVFYIGEAQGLPYIVFEFIEGVNVRDLISQRGPLPVQDAVSCTLQIAGALAHASSRDVVHRDVKPSNILITPGGRAKLVDMGLARQFHMDQSRSDLTATGVTLGTFDYISPEQARDPRNVDVRSDIYSLGCTLYFMLTGRPPFPEGTVLQKLLQHQGEEPPDPRDLNPAITDDTAQIVRKMMAKDPAKRYQTPTELISDLMMLAGNLGLKASGPAGLVWVSPESVRVPWWERHMPWVAPVAALLMAVALMEFVSRPESGFLADDQANIAEVTPASVATQPGKKSPGAESEASPPAAVTKETEPKTKLAAPASTGNGKTAEPNLTPSKTTNLTSKQPSVVKGETPGKSKPPTKNKTDPRPAVLADGYLVTVQGQTKSFESLRDAYTAATSQDEIEIVLRFDGTRQEKPLDLKKSLTLRAADGFHPSIAFQYQEERPQMLKIMGPRLTVLGVNLEMDVPQQFTFDRLALFGTRPGCWLTLRNTSLTIRNPLNHLAVSFIELAPPLAGEGMVTGKMEDLPEPVQVVMSDFIARGDATLVQTHELQRVELTANNGFLALGRQFRLLQIWGPRMPPPAEARNQIRLDRVSALLRGGLVRMNNDKGSPPLALKLVCNNSVLVGADPAGTGLDPSPLVEQVGVDSATARQSRFFVWNGDHVAYSGFRSFWRVSPASADPDDLGYDQWCDFWAYQESAPRRLEALNFRESLPPLETPVTSILPAVLQTDQEGAGAELSMLPNVSSGAGE